MNRDVVFWGATGQARVLREIIENDGDRLVALFDNDRTVTPPFADVPLFYGKDGFAEWRRSFRGDGHSLVAIGGSRGRDRVELQHFLANDGFPALTAIHKSAWVSPSATIGAGSQIVANSAVCVGARLGECCIVNSSANVDHDCILGDGVHVAPGATLAGEVVVGAFTLIGAGAVVLPKLTIGANVIVAAGAVVTRDLPDGVVAIGSPARVREERGR